MVMKKSLFKTKVKSKRRAKVISIKNLRSFKKSIRTLLKGRYTLGDQRALILAQNRAKAQLRRKNLSTKERLQMSAIAKVAIPSARKVLAARRFLRKAKKVVKAKLKAGEKLVESQKKKGGIALRKQRKFEKRSRKEFDKFLMKL